MISFVLQILEQSLVYFPLVMGVSLSFFVLKIPDLSIDGCFVLGAASFAKAVHLGCPAVLATLVAMGFGVLSGLLFSFVQRKERINPIIASILMLLFLHSFNLMIMGRPNLSLYSHSNLFVDLMPGFVSENYSESFRVVILFLISSVILVFLSLFMLSKKGLCFKAYGNNKKLLESLGYSSEKTRTIGLVVSHTLYALSGCLMAQTVGYADISMGLGQVLIGITILLLGSQCMNLTKLLTQSFGPKAMFSFLGALFYFSIISFLVSLGINPYYLKMVIALTLFALLFMAQTKEVSDIGLVK